MRTCAAIQRDEVKSASKKKNKKIRPERNSSVTLFYGTEQFRHIILRNGTGSNAHTTTTNVACASGLVTDLDAV